MPDITSLNKSLIIVRRHLISGCYVISYLAICFGCEVKDKQFWYSNRNEQAYTQVSRLGRPFFAELALKEDHSDEFQISDPDLDVPTLADDLAAHISEVRLELAEVFDTKSGVDLSPTEVAAAFLPDVLEVDLTGDDLSFSSLNGRLPGDQAYEYMLEIFWNISIDQGLDAEENEQFFYADFPYLGRQQSLQ